MKFNRVLLMAAVGFVLSSCLVSKKAKQTPIGRTATNSIVKVDTSKKTSADTVAKAKMKNYKEIITSKAITDSGLFIVHKLENKYFFEIPNALLEKDILVVNRIAKAATDNRPVEGFLGYAGDQIGKKIIRISKGPSDKLFVKRISFNERSTDSTQNGMYKVVSNSNLQPIIASFDVKAYSVDTSASVIDVTDYLNADISIFNFDPGVKKTFGLAGLQKDKSFIDTIQSFPINLEVQSLNTYVMGEATATYELNTSLVMLPEKPMIPRHYDQRIGYFGGSYYDYDDPKGVDVTGFINRWRLEPKDKDINKYLRGELVEPKKPIVYYIDPATPKKWVPYLIQGVNDWQKAFEKAGFKNAIYALEAPVNNPEWSLYDARHNAIVYKASIVANASGPHVNDPRTGEILETHINWYHNIQEILHDWYMVQVGPNDPNGRTMKFSDELIGELIRYVCAHEVGHTLGLLHNFGSSSTVPVDSLRSKSYLEKNGFCPSIMDYSRFNYVAQPADHIPVKELFPRIGIYDEWAIEWGYKWLPQLKTRDEEKAYMNKWIISQLKKDKRYWYGEQYAAFPTDPRRQSEDLGDDAMKAGTYGIMNLKIVMSNLKDWLKEPNEDYSALNRMHLQTISQYFEYIMHAVHNIGLFTWTVKKQGEEGTVVGVIPKQKQKEAVLFLQAQLFNTPEWLFNKDIFSLVGGYGANAAGIIQEKALAEVLNLDVFQRSEYSRMVDPKESYPFDELLGDLEEGIWKELKTGTSIDFSRRRLQKIYVQQLLKMVDYQNNTNPFFEASNQLKLRSDYLVIVTAQLKILLNKIDRSIPLFKDIESKRHLEFERFLIKKALNPGSFGGNLSSVPLGAVTNNVLTRDELPVFQCHPDRDEKNKQRINSCWSRENLFNKE